MANPKLHLAVLAALPLMAMVSLNASAACTTGSAPLTDANTVTCTEGSSYSNAAGTTVSNTATIATAGATNSVVQLTGNGNTLTNAGIINNAVTYSNTATSSGQFYGIYMGALPGTNVNAVNGITNSGTISAAIGAANFTSLGLNANRINTTAVVGVGTDEFGIYTLTNTGTISASHNGVGRVNGVEAGGNVTSMTITNSGNITGTASATIIKDASTATSFTGHTANFATAASIGVAAGIYAEEEVAELTITNSGTITGVGTYASGIYTRAGENTITNSGTISGTKIGVAQVSDSGEIRSMSLDNSGTITGDILSVNGAALRWWSLSNGEGTGGATINNRLNINSQFGQADSEITNSGTITGNFYYSNGTHELTNEDGATITGNIDLDQRDTIASSIATSSVPANYSELGENAIQTAVSGGTTTITTVGTKSFTFENAGTYAGNMTIRTASSSALGGSAPVASHVTLIPTITGSGGSSLDTPSTNIAGMGSVLTIDATAGVGEVAVAPKSLVTLKAGEYYKVANSLTLTGGATTPTVDNANTPLVNWTIDTNTSGNLVIGVASVNKASEVFGSAITKLSDDAIEALLDSDSSTVGAALQNLTVAEDIEHAGQQLRPEANNASTQAAMAAANQVSSVIGAHQEAVRTASNGNSGVSTGEAAQGVGFWMQGFGFRGDQNQRGGVDGYTADTGGFVLGGDKTIGNGDVRLGAAFAYASTGIDGKGITSANRTDIDSYQGTVYGSYNAGAWYVDAALGYGQHQYDTKRYVALAGASITGKHDANQYLAKASVGYPLAFGKATFTPLASLAYVNLDQDGYTETDPTASGAALTVGSTKTDSFRSGLGAKVSVPLSTGALNTALEARAIWNHEFADTKQDIASSFAGGNSFTTNGVAQARDSANLGLGLSLNSANGQSLSVNYDAEVKSDYISHTAALKFRYDF